MTVVVERSCNRPCPREGGRPGSCTSVRLRVPGEPERALAKATRVAVPRGSVLSLRTGVTGAP